MANQVDAESPWNASPATQGGKDGEWNLTGNEALWNAIWHIEPFIFPERKDSTFSSFGVALRPSWSLSEAESEQQKTVRAQSRSFYFWVTFVKNHIVLFGSCFQAALNSELNTDQEVHIPMAVLNNNW